MSDSPLEHLQLLARIDELVERLEAFSAADIAWQPTHQAQALIRRLLERVSSLRLRLEAPLVVGVFGGTGTGKSSLVNALVGRECTAAGRQRPTTNRPVVVAATELDLEPLGLPAEAVEIVRLEAPILRDLVLIDCPDPDTSETGEAEASNLARLQQILPHCDVLLYTSTQQKYRSARVGDILKAAATGCRLLFVQTHADLDEDIREDWQSRLAEEFTDAEVFLVDSAEALARQQAGRHPGGDFGRLEHLLTSRLAASDRLQIRRANLVDLLAEALETCRGQLDQSWPEVEQLVRALVEQHERLVGTLAEKLSSELDASRYLWERRLVGAVTREWGFSPFSGLLRLGQGLGSLLTSATLMRARSSAQLALLGAWQGGRWLTARSRRRDAERHLEQATSLEIDDAALRESQLVIGGYADSAGFAGQPAATTSVEQLRQDAAVVQETFLEHARGRVDAVIETQARRSCGWRVRLFYELLLGTFLGYLLYRVGRNFFYDAPVSGERYLPLEFYLPALAFLIMWSAVLVMAFTGRLRRGLRAAIGRLSEELARHRVSGGLFPRLEEACDDARRSREQLEAIQRDLKELQASLATPQQVAALRPHFHAPPASD